MFACAKSLLGVAMVAKLICIVAMWLLGGFLLVQGLYSQNILRLKVAHNLPI